MSSRPLSYAVVTPVRDEAANLPRLAGCLTAERVLPSTWLVVDNGSHDGTPELARGLASGHEWIRLLTVAGEDQPARGAPIVRAFHAGIELLAASPPDVVVSVDADISFAPDYFERLLSEFAADPRLGIASGSAWEYRRGRWRQRHLTGSTVWGASRAYRWQCLQTVLPLEQRLGWDGIDEFKANAAGWRTRTFTDLPFRHHRPEGSRDGAWQARVEQGRFAHYVGYRPWYLALRAAFQALRDPRGLGIAWGFLQASMRGEPRLAHEEARRYAREQQRIGALYLRAREALGRRPRRSRAARIRS
jgi:glycosyltransferase involved in cell wall biosynthesis